MNYIMHVKELKRCVIENCQRKHSANGYCKYHNYHLNGGKEKMQQYYLTLKARGVVGSSQNDEARHFKKKICTQCAKLYGQKKHQTERTFMLSKTCSIKCKYKKIIKIKKLRRKKKKYEI